MIGIELVRDRQTKERATSERDALVMAAFRRGLLVLAAGAEHDSSLAAAGASRGSRPTSAVRILDDALAEISNS